MKLIAGTLVLIMGAAGCAGSEAGAGSERAGAGGTSAEAEASAVATGLVEGTPEGGLERWIGEIRAGLDSLPAEARREPAAAKNRALLLYVTRQEYIEIYYGTTGRAVKDAALAEAVMTAEARFHELLRAVNLPDGAVDVAAVAAAAGTLSDQYDRVLARAAELELDLGRPELAAGGSR